MLPARRRLVLLAWKAEMASSVISISMINPSDKADAALPLTSGSRFRVAYHDQSSLRPAGFISRTTDVYACRL